MQPKQNHPATAQLCSKELEQLEHQLESGEPPIPLFRGILQESGVALKQSFENGCHARDLVLQRTHLMDHLLKKAWKIHFGNNRHAAALVAVGGYGRGELHPHSDIDLLLLLRSELDDTTRDAIEQFITFLWDIGLEVGHSVRTIEACEQEAERDITVATNLFEARQLTGPLVLFEAMRNTTSPYRIWSSKEFFKAKCEEQEARYHKYHDTAYNLEPNIKEGPGGLRDIQMIGWVAKRHFGATTLHDLVGQGFLTETEHAILMEGQHFLWQVRFALHIITGRREDRLLFDHQKALATSFGYEDQKNRLAVEQFMKRYYRTIMELSRLNEMLLQLFQEAILYANDSALPKPINRRFQSHKGFIEVTRDDVFLRNPFALLEIFLILQQRPELKGIRASTIRLIRTYRDLINDDFRKDLRARALFMEIMRQPQGITHALRSMNRYGILAAYIPIFGHIVGQMQYDLFHVYTVDEHTLKVVRNLRRFIVPEHFQEYPFLSHIVQRIPKLELLYLAGIFHDIAKGQGGDHSSLGGQIAESFCILHGLSRQDTDLVVWLVCNHLIMSVTAQRSDISDPDVINQFAQTVVDKSHLDHLYLLTVCDIRATNPEIWNSWKQALLQDLYLNTIRSLRRGPEFPLDKEQHLRGIKAMAKAELRKHAITNSAIQQLWGNLSDDYFLRYDPDEIIWHTRSILELESNPDALPLILMRQEPKRGSTALFLYTRNQDHLFAHVTTVLDQMMLNIVDARIIGSEDGFTLDTYLLLDDNSNPITDPTRMQEIHDALKNQLTCETPTSDSVSRRLSRQLKHFPQNTHISFGLDQSRNRTILEVFTADRPGLLSQIGKSFAHCGVRLQNAKITTLGNRAEDVFFITGPDNLPIKDEKDFACLRESIHSGLEEIF